MDPSTPAPVPQGNPYDYILNAPNGKKRPGFIGGGNKTLLSIFFVLGVLVLLAVAFAVFSSLTKKDFSAYDKLTKQQAEIIRIANVGSSKARSASTRNYTQTISFVTTSEQGATLSFLSKSGHKVDLKSLATRDAATDKKLTAAEQTSTYDETLLDVLNGLILDYEKSAKSATTAPAGPTEKALALQMSQNAKTLANAQ